MGVNALLFDGTWINRNKDCKLRLRDSSPKPRRLSTDEESFLGSPASLHSQDGLLADESTSPIFRPGATDTSTSRWRTRKIRFLGLRTTIWTPDTRVFEDRWFSRVIRKFPFLREVWFWTLIYWVGLLSPTLTNPLLKHSTGLPTRPRLHCRHPRPRHRPRSTAPRDTTHPPGATPTHLLGTLHPTLLPRSPMANDANRSYLLHPHPGDNPLPRVAVPLHHHGSAQLLVATPLRSPPPHNGDVQSACVHCLHALAVHAAAAAVGSECDGTEW